MKFKRRLEYTQGYMYIIVKCIFLYKGFEHSWIWGASWNQAPVDTEGYFQILWSNFPVSLLFRKSSLIVESYGV